jgi:hypothetical protein
MLFMKAVCLGKRVNVPLYMTLRVLCLCGHACWSAVCEYCV